MEKFFYFVITPDERVYRMEIESGRVPELEELQKAVGGYIEAVIGLRDPEDGCPHPVVGIVNEEGRLQDLEDNPIASMVLRYPEPLCGNAVILQADGDELVGFDFENANRIGRQINRIRNLYADYFRPKEGTAK